MHRDKLQREDIKSLEVDADATREYNEQQQSLMSTLVFSDSCSSWCACTAGWLRR